MYSVRKPTCRINGFGADALLRFAARSAGCSRSDVGMDAAAMWSASAGPDWDRRMNAKARGWKTFIAECFMAILPGLRLRTIRAPVRAKHARARWRRDRPRIRSWRVPA